MKKIVFIIYSMDNAGGSERVTANIANRLSNDAGYDVSIICLFGTGSYFSLNTNVSFESLARTRTSLLTVGKILVRKINLMRPDVVIGISIQKFNIFLSLCSLFFNQKIKMIASEHLAYNSASRFQNFLKKLLYKRFLTIAVLTKADQSLMLKKRFKNVVLLRNATSYFPANDELSVLTNRQKVILAVGRLEYNKGFDRLIEVWSFVYKRLPDWRLVIVGEGSLKDDLTRQVSTLARCEIHSPTRNLAKYFEDSQLFVLSSRLEGLPMVLIEAMSFGIPCVSFDCETGPREVVSGQNGILVSDGDIQEMADSIVKLANDDSLRTKLSYQCLVDREGYDVKNIVEKWKSMFD